MLLTTGHRKLLIADDSLTIQKVVSLTFFDEGFEVITASDGEQAVLELERSAPDIVLADVFMPKLNGYEVCAHIKADERFRHIPVMLLVGTFEPFDEAEARRVGADDVLTKPFQSIRNLVNKVGGLLGGKTAEESDTKDLSIFPKTDAGTEVRESPGKYPETRSHSASANATSDASALPKSFGGEMNRDASGGMLQSDGMQPAQAESLTGLAADDQMIEATRAEDFMSADKEFVASAPSPRADTTDGGESFDEDSASLTIHQGTPPTSFSPASHEWSGERATAHEARASMGDESMSSRGWNEEQEKALDASTQRAFATRAASAAAVDDALLDLGDVESPAAAAEVDDFILDLADTSFRQPSAAASSAHVGTDAGEEAAAGFSSAQVAGDFAQPAYTESAFGQEAQSSYTAAPVVRPAETAEYEEMPHAEERNSASFIDESASFADEPAQAFGVPVAQVRKVEGTATAYETSALSYEFEQAAMPDDIAGSAGAAVETERDYRYDADASESHMVATTTAAAEVATNRDETSVAGMRVVVAGDNQIRLEQLSPEVIDAIARRAAEQLSERVVQEIAWEVVPQLAELLIKRRLEEERQK